MADWCLLLWAGREVSLSLSRSERRRRYIYKALLLLVARKRRRINDRQKSFAGVRARCWKTAANCCIDYPIWWYHYRPSDIGSLRRGSHIVTTKIYIDSWLFLYILCNLCIIARANTRILLLVSSAVYIFDLCMYIDIL